MHGRHWGNRISRRYRQSFFTDIANKSESLAGKGAYPALMLPVVVDGAPRGIDPSSNGRVRDDAPAPNPCKKVISAHDTVAMLEQECEKIERQWLDRNRLRSRAQLAALGIEDHVAKLEPQRDTPCQADVRGCSAKAMISK
jgi:hypothetical protein